MWRGCPAAAAALHTATQLRKPQPRGSVTTGASKDPGMESTHLPAVTLGSGEGTAGRVTAPLGVLGRGLTSKKASKLCDARSW